MEAYANSSSTSHYLSSQEAKASRQSLPFHASLHSIRKPPAKPWKKPVAPLPPTPAKVYKVEPINFRDVVQKLTGAPEFAVDLSGQKDENDADESSYSYLQPRRLQSVAPSPINVASRSMSSGDFPAPLQLLSSPVKTPLSAVYRELMSESIDSKPWNLSESLMASSTFGIGLSPSSYAWCSFPSPGTLSTLEQSTVL